jgi:hypothetical protein
MSCAWPRSVKVMTHQDGVPSVVTKLAQRSMTLLNLAVWPGSIQRMT